MTLFKKKTIISALFAIICALLLPFLFNLTAENKSAQAFSSPQGGKLGTLYDFSSNSFDKDTLDAIAKATGKYNDINALVSDVTTNNAIIYGNTFGTNTLYFGTNHNDNTPLEWIPVYVSKDNNGNAILTLWYSYCSEANGYQDRVVWTDGTYSSGTQTYHGSTIYTNTYDGSYIRHYLLNGSTDYADSWYGGGKVPPPHDKSEMQKFTDFIEETELFEEGELAKYLVKPKDVSWQMAESTYRNDPSYSGKANYPNEWTNDNLWLPSLTETGTNGQNGIWATTYTQCANTRQSWTRSADPSRYTHVAYLEAPGSYFTYDSVLANVGLRPALHLNLNDAVDAMAIPVISVTAPTIPTKTKTYEAGGCVFAVSGFDSTTMSATAVTQGISWNGTAFVATNAGEYTVKFALLDKTNYVWSGGSTDDIEISLKINRKTVPLSWTTRSVTIDGNAVTVPDLPANAAYSVVYYAAADFDLAAGEPKVGATALNLSAITYDYTSVDTYYAYALLDKNVVYQNNYELTGTKYSSFNIGGGKTGVYVTLDYSSKTYDGTPFVASATPTLSDGSAAGILLTYSYLASDGTTAISAPTDSGTYYVKVEVAPLNSADFAVSGTSVFPVTINKADYDITGVQWKVGTDTFALTDTISYVYDGNVHTLSLTGLSGVIGGLSVTFGGDYSKKNAGTYTATLYITQDTVNYNPCALPATFTWTITQYRIDLSGLTWNYTSPFVYERDAGGAVTHSVAPVLPTGLPDELITVITGSYGGVYSQTEVGTYRATASVLAALKGDPDIQNNYDITYPSAFPATCDWKITELNIEMPAYDGSWTIFDGDDSGHDLAAACGLPADWQYYIDLTVNITLPDGTKQTYDGIDGNNFLGYDAGEYELIFTVKSGVNIGADFNVWIGDDDTQTVNISVAPKTVTVAGWKGSGTKAQAQFAEDGVLSEWYTYVVYDDSGVKAVPDASGAYPAGNYTRTVEPTSQNIEIKFADRNCVAFTVDDSGTETTPAITPVDKPNYIGSFTYDGTEFEINDGNADKYFTGWDSSYMTVISCDKGTDAGDYTVTVALKDTSFTAWADDESTAPLNIIWTISKAKLTGKWDGNGKLTLSAEGMSELPEGLIIYTYTNADGNPVEKLVAGSDYSVTAALNPDFENNFEFDESLTTLTGEPHAFTQPQTSGSGCNGVDPFLFVLIGIALVYIILVILLVHVIIKKRRQREEEEESDFEPDDDNDEDDEEEDEIEEE